MSAFFKLAAVAAALSLIACADDVRLEPIDGDDDTGEVPDGGTPKPPSDRPDGSAPDAGPQIDSGIITDCGNRVIDQGEQCDDGNRDSSDGCTSTCQLESAIEGDICPGTVITLTQDGSYLRGTVQGTTEGAYNQYGSACGGGSGPDVVYTFTPTTSGKAVVRFGADYLGIISARTTCDDTSSESTCGALAAIGTETGFEFPVFAGTPAFLHVDGYAGSAGTFDLQVDVSLAACGNGVAELPERCDDGNTTDGDGCSSSCQFESGGVLSSCPGQPFLMAGAAGQPRVISVTGNTVTEGGQGAPGTGPVNCYFWGGNEVTYAIQPDIDGNAHVALTAGYRHAAVHARRECAQNAYQTDCAVIHTPGLQAIDVPARAGEWLYVVIDSDRDFGGPFEATVTVTPSACANGKVDGGEQCDDGNAVDGDGCDANCALEANPAADSCAGAVVALSNDADVHRGIVTGTTVGAAAKVPYCFDMIQDKITTQSGQPPRIADDQPGDAIYAVTAPVDGRLEVALRDSFQGMISILNGSPCMQRAPLNASGVLANVLACSFAAYQPDSLSDTEPYLVTGHGGAKTASAPVVKDAVYYVVVDARGTRGRETAEGPFTIDMTVLPAECGNGVVDGGEACDDGNTLGSDGCSATCAVEDNLPDTCATAHVLDLAESTPGSYVLSINGSTDNLVANQEFGSSPTNAGACSAPGPDAYYKIVAPAAGVLTITAQSAVIDTVLGLRETCSTNTRPLLCQNGGGIGSDETIARAVSPGDELYIVVDSPGVPDVLGCATGTTYPQCASLVKRGLFGLNVALKPSVCGDGFYAAGSSEQCDDGNTVSGDGCSAACQAEPLANVDICPGYTLDLAQTESGYRGVVAVDTSGLAANYSGACGGSAREGVVRVIAPITGTLRAKATNLDGVTLYARSVCNDPATEFRKTTGSGTTCVSVVHDAVTFQVTATDEYYIFVDGLDGIAGVPTLEVSVTP